MKIARMHRQKRINKKWMKRAFKYKNENHRIRVAIIKDEWADSFTKLGM